MNILVQPVIMAGGSGTRLWPLSRAGYPKQFLVLSGDPANQHSLFQQAVARLRGLATEGITVAGPVIVGNEEHRFLVLDQLHALRVEPAAALLEPVGRNTAPAVTLAALAALEDGQDPVLVVTPADQTGWNDYRVNPDGDQAVWTHSSFGVPPSTSLMNLDGHRVIRPINANIKLKETVARLARSPVEWFQTTIGDGLTMDGWLIKPPDFDPNKRYPLLIHVYGEPAGQTVADRWGGSNYLWHLYLAQQGYLVASMDNRGTKTPKGRAWRKSIYRKIGVHASNDQATGARELARRPYVDAGKLAVWGWSGGGSMTLNLLFRFPELYATGMSVAPVPDMSLYDTIYQERYMGLPGPNAADYKAGSPLSHASGLKGNLLLVHGTGDDNCHYQGTEKLMEVLVADNKPFTLMPYPNRSHSINEGKNTTRHLYQLMTRYLNEKTAPGGR